MDLASADKLEEIVRNGLADENLHAKALLAKNILSHRPFTPQEKLLRHIDLAVKFGGNLTSYSPSGRHFSIVQFYNLDIFALAFCLVITVIYVVFVVISRICNTSSYKTKRE